MSDGTYAGDVSPEETWAMLTEEPTSVFVDVRTQAEWSYVGVVDLSSLGKEPLLVYWKILPAMEHNPPIAAEVEAGGATKDTPLLFLCRSGVRSKAAAAAMTTLGYTRCYNITQGFEGDPDEAKHRGTSGGWKVDGLPWVQG